MLIELSFVSQHVSLLSFLVFLFHLSAKPTVQSDLQLFQFLQTKIKFSKKAKTSPMKIMLLCFNCFTFGFGAYN